MVREYETGIHLAPRRGAVILAAPTGWSSLRYDHRLLSRKPSGFALLLLVLYLCGVTRKHRREYPGGVLVFANPRAVSIFRHALGKFVKRLSQVPKIGIEGNEARRSLKEGLPAGVIGQTI